MLLFCQMLCWEILSSCRIARKFPKLSYYAMLSLASSKQGLVKYIHAMMKIFLSLWTYVFSIKQLSQWTSWVEWKVWVMLSGYTRPWTWVVYLTCGMPPRHKGIWRPSVEKAYSATTWQYGLCLDHIGS